MSLTYTIQESANKYGLNNMAVSPALFAQQSSVVGEYLEPRVTENGSFLRIDLDTTKGFTTTVQSNLTSETTAVISSLVFKKGVETLVTSTGNISFSLFDPGIIGDQAYIFSGADTINGNSYNNALKGFGGNDRIDAGAGVDTAYFSGFKSQYQLTKSGNTTIVNGQDGFDTLLNVERLRFDDKVVAFDINGNSGQAYRMYQAAFDRVPDQPGLGAQINGMDNGLSLLQIAQNFMDSAEFGLRYGASQSNGDFVTQLYQNVLHRLPDAPGYAHQLNAINTGVVTRAQLLLNFSESPENQAALIGTIQNGIEYIPFA